VNGKNLPNLLPALTDIAFKGKRVLVRVDFNVPLDANGKVENNTRILAALPTIRHILAASGAVILVSHLGRPDPAADSKTNQKFSLQPLLPLLQRELQLPNGNIKFAANWIDGVAVEPGSVVLCENVRFLPGEETNDLALAKKMAALCDVFVMDAFATCHRAHASTAGVARFVKQKAAGMLLTSEINALNRVLSNPKAPVVAIVGGAKVSSKLEVLAHIIPKVKYLIVGGGIANTFLKATGVAVGSSLVEESQLGLVADLLKLAEASNTQIVLPQDVVVANGLESNLAKETKVTKVIGTGVGAAQALVPSDKIFDIGLQTIGAYRDIIMNAATILWNGPVGVFENENFAEGTKELALAIAANKRAFSVAGGDTIFAIEKFKVTEKISYISTGGGAFLEFIEGKILPGIAALVG
jgi:phosphoglycerate kinase